MRQPIIWFVFGFACGLAVMQERANFRLTECHDLLRDVANTAQNYAHEIQKRCVCPTDGKGGH